MIGFLPALLLIGLGQCLCFGPLTAAGFAGARAEHAGAASGVVNTAHQHGATLGIAVLGVRRPQSSSALTRSAACVTPRLAATRSNGTDYKIDGDGQLVVFRVQ